jgi:hypothetical protein
VQGTLDLRLTAGGTAIREIAFGDTEGEILSVYSVDRGALIVTVYSPLGNQPRLRAASGGPDRVAFEYDQGGNLSSRDDLHVDSLVVTILGADKFKQDWTLWEKGAVKRTMSLIWSRVGAPPAASDPRGDSTGVAPSHSFIGTWTPTWIPNSLPGAMAPTEDVYEFRADRTVVVLSSPFYQLKRLDGTPAPREVGRYRWKATESIEGKGPVWQITLFALDDTGEKAPIRRLKLVIDDGHKGAILHADSPQPRYQNYEWAK